MTRQISCSGWTVETGATGFVDLEDARITMTHADRPGLMFMLTLDGALWLARHLQGAVREMREGFENRHNPYAGKALRLTVRADVPAREGHRWLRRAPDTGTLDSGYAIGANIDAAWSSGESTETHAPYILATVKWLAENPGHPFDVFICDAAGMPEWDPDAAAE